jgi:hypothetical protein
MDPIELNVVFYEDGDLWVAQAIEFDMLLARISPRNCLARSSAPSWRTLSPIKNSDASA